MRKAVAILEIIDGIFVILSLLFLTLIFHAKDMTSATVGFPILSLIIGILLAGLNFFAGIQLWRNTQKGYIASLFLQVIQLIRIQTTSFHYLFYALFAVIISFSKQGMMTLFAIGSSYFISFDNQPVPSLFIGINLVALSVLIILIFCYRKNKPINSPT